MGDNIRRIYYARKILRDTCECGELGQTFSQHSPSTPMSFDMCDQAFSFNELLLNSFNNVSYKTGYFSTEVINMSSNSHHLDADIADATYKINYDATIVIGLILRAL